ncbi:juvenile hormone epoxide hydrolase 2-like [Drosophila nasuta]|uniref:juvenile hormone epoxide hydrolase 2-like n=1 Tax=Drosophila nasuta TaxID=42062 RepID=UPI00295F16B2|nr:juvenile hormone epoxide hydrolase 2-like [Drosophila nasuta]
MSSITRILLILLAIGGGLVYNQLQQLWGDVPPPTLDAQQWWGKDASPKDYDVYLASTSKVLESRLVYPKSTINELRQQLNRTLRLTPPLNGVGFRYGFNSDYLRELVAYWRDDYLQRWREREEFLWQFNHFTTEIQGLSTHFLHLKVKDEDKVGKQHYALLLLHGWPGSVREFYEFSHLLHQTKLDPTNKYIFDVIVPSLPGYGWSQGSARTGLGPAQMTVILHNLMLRLGYNKFFIHGGDVGTIVGSHMATLYPENVLGFHSNMCTNLSPKSQVKAWLANLWPSLFVSKELEDFFFPKAKEASFMIEESGYFHLQATKPDTIGSALNNNPVGLAAYILEKFSTWTNASYRALPDGGLTQRYTLDALFDNVMIYYLTNSITTSQRLYAESYSNAQRALNLERVPTAVPTGCARFKGDLMQFLDIQLQDKFKNLIHSTYYRRGGHFAALEVPKVLYDDFIEFVKKVERKFNIKTL